MRIWPGARAPRHVHETMQVAMDHVVPLSPTPHTPATASTQPMEETPERGEKRVRTPDDLFQMHRVYGVALSVLQQQLQQRGLFQHTDPISDRVGLARAYASPDGLYFNNSTLYVRGTNSVEEAAVEWPKLAVGNYEGVDLYHEALAAIRDRYAYDDRVTTRVVGHSLGGAVAEALMSHRTDAMVTDSEGLSRPSPYLQHLETATAYNGWESPLRPRPEAVQRYGHIFDPVTFFGSLDHVTLPTNWNPHDYGDIPEAQLVRDQRHEVVGRITQRLEQYWQLPSGSLAGPGDTIRPWDQQLERILSGEPPVAIYRTAHGTRGQTTWY